MEESIHFEYSLFADQAIIEKETDKVSLIGLFDNVSSGPPFVIARLSFYLRYSTEKALTADLKCRVFAMMQGDKQIPMMETPFTMNTPGGPGSMVINMIGLPVAGKELIFSIYAGTKELHRKTLKIQEGPSKEGSK